MYFFKQLIPLFLISSIFSYVIFPLNNDDYNLTSTDSPKNLIEKLIDSKLYVLINIGSEKINVKCYLVLSRTEFMIAGKDIQYHKYNELNSKSYNCTYCNSQRLYYGPYSEGIISIEDLNILNEKNETQLIHNMKFILGTEASNSIAPEGIIGLHIQYYDSYLEYNFFKNLKKENVTNSYYWYLNFDNIESKMIVGGFPHDLDNKKYIKEKFIETNTLKGGYYKIWGLEFTNIYYNNININISSSECNTASIKFENGLIVAPEETRNILEEQFFKEYYDRNICLKESLGTYKENFIYCKNTKEFDIKKFKTIYFKNIDLNCIFELNYEDLFFYKGDYIYFLILFKGTEWIFGKLFLKKYYLVFNNDKETIGYYEGMEKEKSTEYNDKSENNFKINLIHILLILILISIIIVGIIIYTKKGKRKNRANELDDDNYEYNAVINDSDNGKNKIIESN